MHNIAIANSNGRVILNGVEKILKGMKQADAYQSLKGIIASDQAIIEVNPILLIDEYDVKAGHGATIGKLDENSVYYLMSRGLTRKDAERLMINGFLNPIISEIEDEPLKERFVSLVNQRL
jgi:Fe-S cluster assembly protein SufD